MDYLRELWYYRSEKRLKYADFSRSGLRFINFNENFLSDRDFQTKLFQFNFILIMVIVIAQLILSTIIRADPRQTNTCRWPFCLHLVRFTTKFSRNKAFAAFFTILPMSSLDSLQNSIGETLEIETIYLCQRDFREILKDLSIKKELKLYYA